MPVVPVAVAEPPAPALAGGLVTDEPPGAPVTVVPVVTDLPGVPTTVTDVPTTVLPGCLTFGACDAAVAVPAPAARITAPMTIFLRFGR